MNIFRKSKQDRKTYEDGKMAGAEEALNKMITIAREFHKSKGDIAPESADFYTACAFYRMFDCATEAVRQLKKDWEIKERKEKGE